MTGTTPVANKRYQKILYQIDIGSGLKDIVEVRADIADYFNMGVTDVVATDAAKTVARTASGATVYDSPTDDTPRSVSMKTATPYVTPSGKNRYTSVKSLNGSKGRRSKPKRCRVPLGKVTAKKNQRTATIAFPSKAINAAISFFLFAKCVKDKPAYFINERGSRIPVIAKPASGDVNPGQSSTPATP